MRYQLWVIGLCLLSACAPPASNVPTGAPCTYSIGDVPVPGKTWAQWSTWKRTITVCGYGSQPKEVSPGVFEGSEFAVVSRQSGYEGVVADAGTNELVRYEGKGQNIIVTEYAKPNHLPMVRHVLSVFESDRSYFVYPGQPYDDARFTAMLQELYGPSLTQDDRTKLLYELRDMAVNAPKQSLAKIHDLQHAPWASGDVATLIDEITTQVELARDLPHRKG
jgi:hypothetical protein